MSDYNPISKESNIIPFAILGILIGLLVGVFGSQHGWFSDEYVDPLLKHIREQSELENGNHLANKNVPDVRQCQNDNTNSVQLVQAAYNHQLTVYEEKLQHTENKLAACAGAATSLLESKSVQLGENDVIISRAQLEDLHDEYSKNLKEAIKESGKITMKMVKAMCDNGTIDFGNDVKYSCKRIK